MKRLFDLAVALVLLLLLAPLLAIVAWRVRRSMGPPVIFRQMRPGLRGRPFEMIKFRTMRHAVDPEGKPLADSERLTPFGRWLRATSLDELPELWNVVQGDMSLVGPRPLLMEYLALYSAEETRRHEVRPGVTGWAQVNGRNAIGWTQKFKLDVWYVDNKSFWLDMKILMMTVRKVLLSEGISSTGSATMEQFLGSSSSSAAVERGEGPATSDAIGQGQPVPRRSPRRNTRYTRRGD